MASNPERESLRSDPRSEDAAPPASPLQAHSNAPDPLPGPPADSSQPTEPPTKEDLAENRRELIESLGTSPLENRSNTPEGEGTDPPSAPIDPASAEPLPLDGTVVDPDATLVAKAQNGSTDAFSELVARHQDKVYTRIYYMVHDAELAADLVQEAFLKVFRGLRLFRSEARFSTWLHRIAVNVCLHHFEYQRAQKRAGNVVSLSAMRGEENEEFEVSDHSQRPDTQSELSEQHSLVLRAMAELDPQYRMALTLRELQGFTYQEIERVMDIPIGTVKSKIFRARQILQEKLKGLL